MALKYEYDKEDDVFTIYDSENAPTETIEFFEFLNIDINKNKGIVGLEFFYASEFFTLTNDMVTKTFLENISDVKLNCNNYRNVYWVISLIFNYKGQEIRVQLPPLRKSEYTSPLIASCE